MCLFHLSVFFVGTVGFADSIYLIVLRSFEIQFRNLVIVLLSVDRRVKLVKCGMEIDRDCEQYALMAIGTKIYIDDDVVDFDYVFSEIVVDEKRDRMLFREQFAGVDRSVERKTKINHNERTNEQILVCNECKKRTHSAERKCRTRTRNNSIKKHLV